jgi:nucleotide-binding universal stress UspA family protein
MVSVRSAQAPIVVGVDGSKPALDAVRWAACESRYRNTGLRLVDAVGTMPAPRPGDPRVGALYREALIDEAANAVGAAAGVAQQTAPGTNVVTEVLAGEPVPGLVAESEHAQLVVLGRPGRGWRRGVADRLGGRGAGRTRAVSGRRGARVRGRRSGADGWPRGGGGGRIPRRCRGARVRLRGGVGPADTARRGARVAGHRRGPGVASAGRRGRLPGREPGRVARRVGGRGSRTSPCSGWWPGTVRHTRCWSSPPEPSSWSSGRAGVGPSPDWSWARSARRCCTTRRARSPSFARTVPQPAEEDGTFAPGAARCAGRTVEMPETRWRGARSRR